MKLVTWNVNSVRARLERVTGWLEQHQPDVICLQELKSEEDKFPADAFKALGYSCAGVYQRTYNGVAILSRLPMHDIQFGLDDGDPDPEARFVSATVEGVRIMSAYIPNGQMVGSPKYAYKLRWLARLRDHLDRHHRPDESLALCGDFNVAPEPRDVHDPEFWSRQTLFHVDSRAALEKVRAFGLVDLFRQFHAAPGMYSWWDYRMLAFPRNLGLRIDHILCTPRVAQRAKDCHMDREARKGKLPSDHIPVIALLE